LGVLQMSQFFVYQTLLELVLHVASYYFVFLTCVITTLLA
jgi:hypothetical protein